MPPTLALLLAFALAAYAFSRERLRTTLVSRALFWPTLWYMVASSRPVGVWLILWGIPVPGSNSVEDGSFIERIFYLSLTFIGIRILRRRSIDWGRIWRQNGWLVVFAVFMLLSVTWSAYPYISFKRFIKMAGSIVMALVILTEEHPFEAIKAIIRRCAYVHIPMSVVCIKYFRHIGVSFDWSGKAEAWQGIASSKNVLGQVVMVAVLYFIYDVIHHWRRLGWRNLSVLYIVMGGYLLKGSDSEISMTSVAVFGLGLFVFLRLEMLRDRREAIRPFVWKMMALTFGLIVLVAVHSVVMFREDSIFGWLITKLGRDITLTDRTTIWSEVYDAAASNPLFGVGFGGFWIGQEANIEFSRRMTWTLGQAHSGYVDTYLQTGWVGICLMAGAFLTAARRLLDEPPRDFEAGRWKVILFVVALFVNITETSHLRGDHHLWLLFLLSLVDVTGAVRGQTLNSDGDEQNDPRASAWAPVPVRAAEVMAFPQEEVARMRALHDARLHAWRNGEAPDFTDEE